MLFSHLARGHNMFIICLHFQNIVILNIADDFINDYDLDTATPRKIGAFRHSDATIRVALRKKCRNPHICDFFFAWESQTSRYPKSLGEENNHGAMQPAQYTLTRKLGAARETARLTTATLDKSRESDHSSKLPTGELID